MLPVSSVLILLAMSGYGGMPEGSLEKQPMSRLAMVRSLWEQSYTASTKVTPSPGPYPTERALVFLSAYANTHDPRFAAQASSLLDYAHTLEKKGMIVVTGGKTTRDYQARQIYNFYVAYRILGEGKYLRWADACARAMIDILPRADHTCMGQTYKQFFAGFYPVEGTPPTSVTCNIDVNQNAEIGLAYGLLYHDPASAFFLDPLAKEISLNELRASMSVQDKETGGIPLTEGSRIHEFDTAYGSYAAFSWVWGQLLWRDAEMDKHVRAAGRWLGSRLNLSKDSERYYSFRNPATSMPYWEVYYRIPVLWYCQVDASQFLTDVFARMPRPELTPDDAGGPPWMYAYYDLMGLPRTYYLEGQVDKDAPWNLCQK